MRTKRLYRAVAHYKGDAFTKPYTVTRHFQSKKARDEWAVQRLEGYPAQNDGVSPYDDRPEIPPATRVDKADSEPIVFLVDYPVGLHSV